MADIEKIIDNLNLPKQLLEKGEALLKTLFGPSFEELGGMIADEVRLRRYNNQVKIFTKAKENLAKNNIDPKKVSFKILAPLIEYSALEEDENLQTRWANLISHVLAGGKDSIFQQNCISILNKITSEEAKLLDTLHSILEKRKLERYKKSVEQYENRKVRQPSITPPLKVEEYRVSNFEFSVNGIARDLKLDRVDFEFSIANLIALGLLKWETNVEVEAEKSSDDPDDQSIDVDVDVSNNDAFSFTSIGDKFIKVCKG